MCVILLDNGNYLLLYDAAGAKSSVFGKIQDHYHWVIRAIKYVYYRGHPANMFIKLTNAHPKYHGSPVLLNTAMIVSVHRSEIEREQGEADTVTFVHCPPHGTWEVTETVEDIADHMALAPKWI